MAASVYPQPNSHLDYLLSQVAIALQLSPDQFRLAVQHYEAIAAHLEAFGSPVARYSPLIYPQGSMALETTVRPLAREEYDLDLVCQLLRTGMDAVSVYNLVFDRIAAHATYAKMIEKKNRCIRINYAHNFHLDLIPAELDPTRGGSAIVVPDRSLRDWTPSNPKGYVAWFKSREIMSVRMAKRADPLPLPTPVEDKSALALAVQLVKRRRDILCTNAELAPRSIVLTTLAGQHYRGSDSVVTALGQIVSGIQMQIANMAPKRIEVCNPTNDGERFCESFEGAGRYEAFKDFVNQLTRDVQLMMAVESIPRLQEILAKMFGEEPVQKAIRSYGAMQKAQRDAGNLKFTGVATGGLSILPGSTATRSVPKNQYFGGE
jgi:hypothetical protein